LGRPALVFQKTEDLVKRRRMCHDHVVGKFRVAKERYRRVEKEVTTNKFSIKVKERYK
jgi:hypothetical protein